MGRRNTTLVMYSSGRRQEKRPSSLLGSALLVLGLILILLGGLRFLDGCFHSGFLFMAGGTLVIGIGAVLLWRLPRILEIVVTITAVLVMTAFLFGGFC